MTPRSMAPSAAKADALPAIIQTTRKQTTGDSTGSKRGHDHLLDRGAGEHVDRAAVVGLVLALHDAGASP